MNSQAPLGEPGGAFRFSRCVPLPLPRLRSASEADPSPSQTMQCKLVFTRMD